MVGTQATKRADLPPGPRLPSLIQVLLWGRWPVRLLESCSRKFGRSFTLRFPRYPPMVFVSDPEAIREIFAGDPAQLHAGEANRILKPLVGVHSLLLLDGERHRKERKLLMPPLHGERMRAYGETMRSITGRRLDAWPVGRPFSAHSEMQRVALEVILHTILGLDEGERMTELRRRIVRLLGFGTHPGLLFLITPHGDVLLRGLQLRLGRFSALTRFVRLRQSVCDLLAAEISARSERGAAGREDVLSMLIEARDERGGRMTHEELLDEMMTLIVAGHETTATALSWTLLRLLSHPEAMARVRDELSAVGGGGPIQPERIGELRFLDATIKETLRLNPVLPIVVRRLRSEQRLGDLELPAGVMVAPCVYLTHRDPELWPDPSSFRPQRFLERPPRSHHFFPFGGGARTCVGMAFAYYEMKVVLAEVLTRARLRPQPGYRARLVRRSITFAPSRGLPVIADAVAPVLSRGRDPGEAGAGVR